MLRPHERRCMADALVEIEEPFGNLGADAYQQLRSPAATIALTPAMLHL